MCNIQLSRVMYTILLITLQNSKNISISLSIVHQEVAQPGAWGWENKFRPRAWHQVDKVCVM